MDMRREDPVSEVKDFQITSSWVPSTPLKPLQVESHPIYTDRQQNQLGGANLSETERVPQETGLHHKNLSESDKSPPGLSRENQAQTATAPAYWESIASGNLTRDFSHWESVKHQDLSQFDVVCNESIDPLHDYNMPFGDLLALASRSNAPTTSVDVTRLRNVCQPSGNGHFPNLNSFDLNQLDSSSGHSRLTNENPLLGTNFWSTYCVQDAPQRTSAIPTRLTFDLNSPRRTTDAGLSRNSTLQFAPVTPDQAMRAENKEVSEIQNASAGKRIYQSTDGLENEVATSGVEVSNLHEKEQTQLLEESLCQAVSTPLQENHNPDKGGNHQVIDPNRTQQKPRRKKHRPKVVIEGKSQRIRKPATPKPDGPSENPTGKRKYVRRKGLENSASTPSAEVPSQTTEPRTVGDREKSCRRTLNFDFENQVTKESSSPIQPTNLNSESQAQNFCTRVPSKSAVRLGEGLEVMVEKTQVGVAYDLTLSMNQMLEGYISMPERQNPCPSVPPKADPQHEKLKEDARNECKRGKCQIVFSNETHDKQECTPNRMVNTDPQSAPRSPDDSNCSSSACLTRGEHERGQKRPGSCPIDEAQLGNENFRGTDYNALQAQKRPRSCIIDEAQLTNVNVTGSDYNALQAYMMVPVLDFSNHLPHMHFPAIYKKKRTEKSQISTISSTMSTATAAENSMRQTTAFPRNNGFGNPIATAAENNMRQATAFPRNNGFGNPIISQAECRFPAAQFHGSYNITKAAATNSTKNYQQDLHYTLPLPNGERLTKKRSNGPTRMRDLASLVRIVECNQQPIFPGRAPTSGYRQGFGASQQSHTCMETLMAGSRPTTATKKRTRRNTPVSSVPHFMLNHYQSFTRSKGPSNMIWKNMSPLDAIVEHLKRLDINATSSHVAYKEQNALVPYNSRYQDHNALVLYQRDGTLVPFMGSFDPSKRRKPRAKVDLDEETNRVWKLLLENINSEGVDGTDEEKARWWEEERAVFRGRADSFIARMHLVQGDRRFSRWKGSVVDSVVGVFLTQNVSDHLSSSAFMSLAARFPLKSECDHAPSSRDRNNILVEEPDICILDPEDTIKWHEEKLNRPFCDQSSVILHDVAYNGEKVVNSERTYESNTDGVGSTYDSVYELPDSPEGGLQACDVTAVNKSTTPSTGTVTSFIEDERELDDVLSSQNSVNSSTVPTTNGTGSCSPSDSNDPTAMPMTKNFGDSTSFVELLQRAGTTMLHGSYTGNLAPCEDEHNQEKILTYNSKEQNEISDQCSNYALRMTPNSGAQGVESIQISKRCRLSDTANKNEEKCTSEQSGMTTEPINETTFHNIATASFQEVCLSSNNIQGVENQLLQSQSIDAQQPKNNIGLPPQGHINQIQQAPKVPNVSPETLDITESNSVTDNGGMPGHDVAESNINAHGYLPGNTVNALNADTSKGKRVKLRKEELDPVDWDNLRKQAQANGKKREQTANTMDSLDWEAVRCAHVGEIADTIKERGMNNMLAERIKDFLNRLVREHGSIDLEWLRDVPPDKAKEYLLSIRGLGLKSVECVRLLTLHHLAFPVDTNVGRIAVRLGWVPLQPLPESLQLHLLELYPILESIQKYLWPRLCKLDQRTLYELHYQMITFGKVFCTKNKPNCNACPMRGECRHFASAFASARLALPGPEEKRIVCAAADKAANQNSTVITNPLQLPMPHARPEEKRIVCAAADNTDNQNSTVITNPLQLPLPQANHLPEALREYRNSEPIVEVPASPEPIIEEPMTPESEHTKIAEGDIEDTVGDDPDEIPTIELNIREFAQNLQNYMQNNMELQEADMSKALVALTPEAAAIPTAKLKNVSRLRTEHQVYELPDSHPLLEGLDRREPDDPCSYLLAIWTPGETASSIEPPDIRCNSQEFGKLCDETTCFSCNSVREANTQTVRGTILIPCRTAMRGSFPLNGTYFQVNEVFADHDSSINPIDVPRAWIWNLPRRTVYFGTSIPTIFKGLTTEGIQYCFWRGFVCVRGFDQKTRAPRPLMARLHFPASKLTRTKGKTDDQ